jgi:LmeA-like phospholipid-binding
VRRPAVGAAVLVVALLVLSQVGLPLLAESRLRSELDETGDVTSVDVSAFPALKLLFQRADSVRVRMSSASVGVGDLGDRLASTSRAEKLDFSVDSLSLGPLQIRDVSLTKDGDDLQGMASVTSSDLEAALPVDLGLHPVESSDGALVMEAEVGPIAVRGRLSDSDGALLIAPDGLLGGFASLTVFDDPRVEIDGVTAQPYPDGFTIVTNATLHPED